MKTLTKAQIEDAAQAMYDMFPNYGAVFTWSEANEMAKTNSPLKDYISLFRRMARAAAKHLQYQEKKR